MNSFIYIPEISIYIFINIKISIKRCKNVEFFTKNALQTAKCKILFKIVEKVSKYEKNNTIHNGCWRYGPEYQYSTIYNSRINLIKAPNWMMAKKARERSSKKSSRQPGQQLWWWWPYIILELFQLLRKNRQIDTC